VLNSIGFMKVELFYAESGGTIFQKDFLKQAKKLAIKESGKASEITIRASHLRSGTLWPILTFRDE